MKLSHLSTALILATLPTTGAFAAALDRSGQSMNAFFQDGNYFEANLSVLDPSVSGQEANNVATQNAGTARTIGDMGDNYIFPTAALKIQPHKNFSIGVLYDQPFGANAQYSGENKFVSNPIETTATSAATANALLNQAITAAQAQAAAAGTTLTQAQMVAIAQNVYTRVQQLSLATAKSSTVDLQGTNVDVHTETLSLVLGYQPTKNWNFYAGPVYQNVEADVNLRGTAYSVYNGYDLNVAKDGALGWLAGVAYSKPEIALRAAITYRSGIEHKFHANENFANIATTAESTIETPQSVNLDLQSGIAANTLAFANVRWVDWDNFKFQPNQFGQLSRLVGAQVGKPDGFNLVEYAKDQISATVGVGRKFNDKWTGSLAVGWDSGAGNPVTTLGPTKGYWNTGLGVQYSPAPNYFIAGGVKYFWLGDAKAQTGAQAGTESYVAEFTDNKALAYGLKLGYRF